MKRIIVTVLALVLMLSAFSLAACNIGGVESVTREEAEIAISNFLGAIGKGDYEKASGYMHPDNASSPEKIGDVVNSLRDIGIDLSKPLAIKRVTSVRAAFFDTKYNGSTYEMSMTAEAGGKTCYIDALVVRNDAGFGVYDIYISN